MPYLRSSSKNSGSTGTAMSVPEPAGAQVGDDIIIVIHGNANTTTADNNGSTPYNKDLNDYAPNTSGHTLAVWSRRKQTGDPTTLNFVLGASGRWSIIAFAIADPDPGATYEVAPSTSNINNNDDDGAGGGNINAPSINTSTAFAMHFVVGVWDTSLEGVKPSPSGYYLVQNTPNQPMHISYKIIPSAGATGTATLTTTEAGSRMALSFAIKCGLRIVEFVNSQTADGSSATPTVAKPTNMQVGDVIVAVVHANGPKDVTDNNGATPFSSVLPNREYNGPSCQYDIFVRVATGSEPANYTWNLSGSDRWSVVVTAYRYADITSFWDVTPSATTENTGTGTAVATAAITTLTNGAMIIVVGFSDTNTLVFDPMPGDMFNTRQMNTGQQLIGYSDKPMQKAGSQASVTMTLSAGNGTWATNIFALKPLATSQIKKLMGVNQASLKKVASLTLATVASVAGVDNS